MVVDGRDPSRIARLIDIPMTGPHGLDLDRARGRLFCACDAAILVTLEAGTGKIDDRQPLNGRPDVVYFNRQQRQHYVAVGDPGVIDVFDTTTMEREVTLATEPGAHTTALSAGLFAYATGSAATGNDDFDNMARQLPAYDALYAYCRTWAKA